MSRLAESVELIGGAPARHHPIRIGVRERVVDSYASQGNLERNGSCDRVVVSMC